MRRLVESSTDIMSIKEIRSRKAGPMRYLDLTLMLCRWESLDHIHRMCDELEEKIESRFPGAQVFIHPEPCLRRPESNNWQACDCPLLLKITLPEKGGAGEQEEAP